MDYDIYKINMLAPMFHLAYTHCHVRCPGPLSNFFPELCSNIREYGSTLYVGLALAVSPTNTNFRLTFLLTRLQEALYEDLAV